MSTVNTNRQHAIVMGGSLSGLLTARVLSKHFERVTIIEKDQVGRQPESRPGQPQTRHLHGLLVTGLRIMTDYFPDLPQALAANGAVVIDPPEHTQWHTYGGYRQRFASGLQGATMSRPLLEHLIRERVLSLPQIELLDRSKVAQLLVTPERERVIGVMLANHGSEKLTTLKADLVVDATGRNTHSPRWLRDLGYEPPPTSEVKVDVAYLTRAYRRDPYDPRSRTLFLNTPTAPQESRGGAMFPIEGDVWVVTVGSWHNDATPPEANSFLELLRNLPSSDIYDIISNSEPLSEIIPYKFAASLRRHYERLRRFPTGYLVLGDAISSFNPTYGQGMTVAAMEAAELDRLLAKNLAPDRLARTFFGRVAKIIDIPWQLAVGEDFRFPQTTGPKPAGVDLINRYISWVHRATLRDQVVAEAFFKVANLMEPPTSLFHPWMVWRVLTA
jgi:2-polyprenyl-6-methoxyphenol hydroxylase-like FAD-dependent oxidoreductase